MDEKGGFTHWFALQRDTTEQYLQRERLKLAHHAAGMGTFDVELPSGKCIWCSRAYKMFGLSADSGQPGPEDIVRMAHPEDRSTVAEQMQLLLSGRRIHIEYRILRPDDEVRWVEISGAGIFDHAGEPVRYLGVVRDVTERKQTEEALRDSQLFAQSRIDALTSHLCVLDEAGNIIAVNRAWREFWEANRDLPPDESGARLSVLGGTADSGNYLDVCDRATGPNAAEAAEVAAEIRAILRGKNDFFAKEYPCHAPQEQRRFFDTERAESRHKRHVACSIGRRLQYDDRSP